MAASFGIDLGSSQCTLASLPLNFVSEGLSWDTAATIVTVPTCLSPEDPQNLETAEKNSSAETLTGFKESLDKPYGLWTAGELQFSAMELAAIVMKRVYQQLEVPIARVHPSTITYPSYYLALGRDQLANAAKIAGYNVGYLISEAVAVANFHASTNGVKGKTLIINWGSKSLTLDVLDILEDSYSEVTSEFSRSWGGDAIDQIIFDFYQTKYKELSGADLLAAGGRSYQFLQSAEEAKKLIATVDPLNATIGNETDGFVQIELNSQILESSIEPLLTHLEFLIERVQQNLQNAGHSFENVILTGGTSQLPVVAAKVEALTGIRPIISDSPRADVAKGAALYGLAPKAVNTITHHAYGTATLALNPKTQKEEVRNAVLIPKGAPLPGSLTQSFATSSALDDTVELEITEGDDTKMDFVQPLGKLTIRLHPIPPEGSEIKTTLECDRFERISAKVLDIISNKEYNVALQPEGEGLTHQKQNSYQFREYIKALK